MISKSLWNCMEFKKDIDDHLHIKDEASKRDHRLL